jgi:hypothetical protein
MAARHVIAFVTGIVAVTSGLAIVTARGQVGSDRTREIIAEEFLKARPAASKSTPAKRPAYRPAQPQAASAANPAGTIDLGVTLWRLRASQPADAGARLLVQESGAGELTAERLDVGQSVAVGDRVRLSIEAPAAGFLYVIDRELYGDGTMSDAYLIFPTSRTRQGDNAVRAGRLVDIPEQQDRPSYFTVRPSRAGQVGELLSIVVTPTRLDDLAIGAAPLKLPPDRVLSWEKTWAAPAQSFTQDGGAGKIWTRQEQQAATETTRLLTQDDPAPQTIFRVAAKKGTPVLVNVKLPYATSKP